MPHPTDQIICKDYQIEVVRELQKYWRFCSILCNVNQCKSFHFQHYRKMAEEVDCVEHVVQANKI